MSAVFVFTVEICRIWLCYAVCGNRRMYAIIRQERESTITGEMFLAVPKCRKRLCYAVCGNRRMYAVTQQERKCTVKDEMFLAVAEVP